MSKKGNQDHPEVKEESEEEIRKEIEKYQKKLKIAVFNHRVIFQALEIRRGRLKDGRIVQERHLDILLGMITNINNAQQPLFRKLEKICKNKEEEQKKVAEREVVQLKKQIKSHKIQIKSQKRSREDEPVSRKTETPTYQPIKRSKRLEALSNPNLKIEVMPPDPGEGLNRIDLLVMNLSDQNQVPDIHNPELKTSFMRCIGLADPPLYEKFLEVFDLERKKFESTKVRDQPFSIRPEHVLSFKKRNNRYLLSSNIVRSTRLLRRNGTSTSTNHLRFVSSS
ncbi:uncharacterized protein LOC136025330 isoform X2 [Artemia franciscana]